MNAVFQQAAGRSPGLRAGDTPYPGYGCWGGCASGITLIETLVAIAVLGIAVTGMMSGVSFMRVQNRASTERMLAASIGTEILEKFKAMPFANIANSPSSSAEFSLVGFGTTSPDTSWDVPISGSSSAAFNTIPVEDANSSTAGYTSLIPNKLPEGKWGVVVTQVSNDANVKQVTVNLSWDVYAGSTLPRSTYSISTMISSYNPSL